MQRHGARRDGLEQPSCHQQRSGMELQTGSRIGSLGPDILIGDLDSAWCQFLGIDVIADRIAEPGAKTGLVGAAIPGRNAVDEALDVFFGRFGPLQCDFDPFTAFLSQSECGLVDRPSLCSATRISVA